MPDIITVTLNPALDLTTRTKNVLPGPKLRCGTPRVDPGGGGINVSRFIRFLDGRSLAVVALGGSIGARVEEKLKSQGVTTCKFDLGQETRQSFTVLDETTGSDYNFVTEGPVWRADNEQGILAMIAGLLRGQEVLVLSGSQPEGVSSEFPSRLNDLGETVGARMVADVTGAALDALTQKPQKLWMIRLAAADARVGTTDISALGKRAAELVAAKVASNVVIDAGLSGAVAASERGVWHARCDNENQNEPVVMGDALIAAMTHSLAGGDPLEKALSAGVALAATAAATSSFDGLSTEEHDKQQAGAKVVAL